MAQLAIKGHNTRGKEVIQLLEMFGGKNIHRLDAIRDCYVYFVMCDKNKTISSLKLSQVRPEQFIIYSLEEFFEKFPYKVGDEVIAYAEGCLTKFTIQDIRWNYELNKVEYKICSSWLDASLIMQLFKEELTMEKINIAELLKDCPRGMELDCTMFDDGTFEGIKQDKGISWKPSKEEMDVLYSLAYITNKYDEHKEKVITRLYQNLKREFFNGSSYENMFPNTEDGVRCLSTIQVLEYARSLDGYNQYGKADIDKNIAWLKKIYKYEGVYSTDKDLQPYKEETMEENRDEPKAPILSNRYDYTEGKCGYVIPDGYEFDYIKEGFQTEIILKPKKPTYPKDYEECFNICFGNKHHIVQVVGLDGLGDNKKLFESFIKLKICRDAYWKIAGEEMGLDKPWEQDYDDRCFIIADNNGNIHTYEYHGNNNVILAFPTEEMRDAFYENFRELIEQCKELL